MIFNKKTLALMVVLLPSGLMAQEVVCHKTSKICHEPESTTVKRIKPENLVTFEVIPEGYRMSLKKQAKAKSEVPSVRCNGITKAGARCKLRTRHELELCHHHRPKQ